MRPAKMGRCRLCVHPTVGLTNDDATSSPDGLTGGSADTKLGQDSLQADLEVSHDRR
jgi:hypothetical protein